MLNKDSIEFLANLGSFELKYVDEMPTGIVSKGTKTDKFLAFDYELAKKAMGLEDIRFHWLLTDNFFMAGGSVLNWVWREQKNGDYDFYFKPQAEQKYLISFIEEIGAKEDGETTYAKSYSVEDGTSIQLVEYKKGTPKEILGGFDLNVCRFAVDGDNFYTTKNAIRDLLSMTLTSQYNENGNIHLLDRIIKYVRKGFMPSKELLLTSRIERRDVQWPTLWEDWGNS